MSRKLSNFALPALLASAGLAAIGLAIQKHRKTPNIVVIAIDNLGCQDTGVSFLESSAGENIPPRLSPRTTPNLALLASQGVRFSNAYSAPGRLAGRVSFLTGLAPVCHGVTDDADNEELDVPSLCSPEPLQSDSMPDVGALEKMISKAGYTSIFVGNTCHLPSSLPPIPKGEDPFEKDEEQASYDSILQQTEAFVKILESETKGKVPFFSCLSFDQLATSDQARSLEGHDKLIAQIDTALGKVLESLNKLEVADRTLVVFCATSGGNAPVESLPFGNVPCSEVVGPSDPLRGYVSSRYEGGTRIPLMLSWAKPDAKSVIQESCPIMAGSKDSRIVAIWDLFPTFARLLKSSISTRIDGYDLIPLLEEQQRSKTVTKDKFAGDENSKDIIRPQWIVQHFPHSHPHARFYSSLRIGKWKVIYSYFEHYANSEGEEWQLFNLSVDPSESHNLADEASDETKNILYILAGKLKEYLDGVHARYPIVTDPHSHRVNGRRQLVAIAEFPLLQQPKQQGDA